MGHSIVTIICFLVLLQRVITNFVRENQDYKRLQRLHWGHYFKSANCTLPTQVSPPLCSLSFLFFLTILVL